MRLTTLVMMGTGLLLCACAGVNNGNSAPRNPFGVSVGAEDGNTFSARPLATGNSDNVPSAPPRAPLVPGRPIVPAVPPDSTAAATLVATPASTPASTPAAAATAQALAVRIDIDPNAYGAVFGAAPAPIKPTPAQLMQLDSLSLVAAESLRVELQTRILECRRAGDACRLGAR